MPWLLVFAVVAFVCGVITERRERNIESAIAFDPVEDEKWLAKLDAEMEAFIEEGR